MSNLIIQGKSNKIEPININKILKKCKYKNYKNVNTDGKYQVAIDGNYFGNAKFSSNDESIYYIDTNFKL